MPSRLSRVLEPEVMDTEEEADDYDAMDHAEVNARFCADLLAVGGDVLAPGARVLDVGTGTALIPVDLLARQGDLSVVAVDMAETMLSLARRNVAGAGLASRVTVDRADAKALPYAPGSFDVVVSNSLVHHIPEPAGALAEMWRMTKQGGLLFVRDLARPDTDAEVEALVARHGGEPPADAKARARHARQVALLRASLFAALTTDEVAEMVAPLGIARSAVVLTSDRHWTLAARKP